MKTIPTMTTTEHTRTDPPRKRTNPTPPGADLPPQSPFKPTLWSSLCDHRPVTSSWDAAQVARDWWEYQRLSSGSRDERKALDLGIAEQPLAAHDLVDETVERGGQEAVDLLAALADAVPTGNDGAAVGAGPLEDLIHEHGDDLVSDIESYARRRPPFAQALGFVWVERGHLSAETEARLEPWVAQFTTNS
jgi:hypothetical protein